MGELDVRGGSSLGQGASPATGDERLRVLSESDLAIVLQGALNEGNLVETANACLHWRRILPAAEIVLSISVADAFVQASLFGEIHPELVSAVGLDRDGISRIAVRRIRETCDRVVESEGALPLPPIKIDRKINNVNLQIAAARAGLAQVSRPYVLRIRSDMVFLNKGFLAFYEENASLRRDPALSSFKQRVLISPFFTLNPFTMERLPFHFSDWFHLGLTEDVRAIWNVDEMSLADATHYAIHRRPSAANRLERKFLLRLAVEQHINFSALSKRHKGLKLDYMIDWRSVERSVGILLNDFVVCDTSRVPVHLEKYSRTFRDPMMELLCITYSQWRALLDLPAGTLFARHFAREARRASLEIAIREEPLLRVVRLSRGLWRQVRRRLLDARSFVSGWNP